MNPVEIKIFGQTFYINPPDGAEEYYVEIASELDKLMSEESKKGELRSDVKVAVKVAFMLAADNRALKDERKRSLELLDRLDKNINSLEV